MCWELLTKGKFYGEHAAMGSVMVMLKGEKPLPCEGDIPEELRKRLGPTAFRKTILSMLHREPAQRPAIGSLLKQWTSVFEHTSAAWSLIKKARVDLITDLNRNMMRLADYAERRTAWEIFNVLEIFKIFKPLQRWCDYFCILIGDVRICH
jgi:hypothetical protein